MRREAQRRDDAEVAAPAAARGPEEFRLAVLVAVPQLAFGGDDVDVRELVAGETPRAREDPDPSTERESGDADPRAAARRQTGARRRDGVVDVDEPRARADGHRSAADRNAREG